MFTLTSKFEVVYSDLQEILEETLGRQVKMFAENKEKDDIRVLHRYDLARLENGKRFKVSLYFEDASIRVFEEVVAATIDWRSADKKSNPIVWFCERPGTGSFSKLLFDIQH